MAITADDIVESETSLAILGRMSAYAVTLKPGINLRIGKKTLRLERFGVANLEHVEVSMDEDLGFRQISCLYNSSYGLLRET